MYPTMDLYDFSYDPSLLFANGGCLVSVWMERLRWQEFFVTRQMDQDHQVLLATQATLQKEKESSESMCLHR